MSKIGLALKAFFKQKHFVRWSQPRTGEPVSRSVYRGGRCHRWLCRRLEKGKKPIPGCGRDPVTTGTLMNTSLPLSLEQLFLTGQKW